jgi:hypothetical protein
MKTEYKTKQILNLEEKSKMLFPQISRPQTLIFFLIMENILPIISYS